MAAASHQDVVSETNCCRVLSAQGSNPEAPATKAMRGEPAVEGGGHEASEIATEMATGIDAANVECRDGATGFQENHDHCVGEKPAAHLSGPPHGGELVERLVSHSSSEQTAEAAAAEHHEMLEGALALPAKPSGGHPSPVLPTPPAPAAPSRMIATPQHHSVVEANRPTASPKAHTESTGATEARNEQRELSLLRAELAEAQGLGIRKRLREKCLAWRDRTPWVRGAIGWGSVRGTEFQVHRGTPCRTERGCL